MAAEKDESKMEKFIKREEEILNTFSMSIKTFEAQTNKLKKIEETVSELKRKSDDDNHNSRKKFRQDVATSQTSSDNDENSDSEDENSLPSGDNYEVTDLLMGNDESESNIGILSEVEQSFAEDHKTGEPVGEKLAIVVNKALRAPTDKEKMKALTEKYKRPENLENLQIPRVENTVWEQLRNDTKLDDASKQKTIGLLNQLLLPTIHAMEELSKAKQPDVNKISEYVGDSFKLMAHHINNINSQRKDNIKKEM
ncbi:uncharacterized protein LOC132756355 [Ruditapes philippinarum]|uniref:uncharacterized protein LOC132756355 n=1 Tax=Ruditapes philippinarum TaxID=129788 RepID=UPI00295A9B98|nr:uncharacterized protein LOC132756355 [Ruditapes philippinarum]